MNILAPPIELPNEILSLRPTRELPGSGGKIRVMQSRLKRGECLFHPNDGIRDEKWIADDRDEDQLYVDQLVDGWLYKLDRTPLVVPLPACETSEDQSKPGCTGQCVWCTHSPEIGD